MTAQEIVNELKKRFPKSESIDVSSEVFSRAANKKNQRFFAISVLFKHGKSYAGYSHVSLKDAYADFMAMVKKNPKPLDLLKQLDESLKGLS